MKKLIAASLIGVGLSMAPAFAGVADCDTDGGGNGTTGVKKVKFHYETVDKYNYIIEHLVKYADDPMYQIDGIATFLNRMSGFQDTKVLETIFTTDLLAGLEEGLGELRDFVWSFPGRTYCYQEIIDQQECGEYVEECIEYENLGTTYDTSVSVDWEASDDAVYVGDPDNWQDLIVLDGEVCIDVTETTIATHDILKTQVDTIYDLICVNLDVKRVQSPIVLDMDQDGDIEASSGQWRPHTIMDRSNAVFFDFDGNGFPLLMEWVGSNDGILVKPLANGEINGRAFFGTANGHQNGFEAMSDLDMNQDGKLTGAELEGLKIWQDKNTNAWADQGELMSLQELGITELSVNHDDFESYYVRNGEKHLMVDWWPSSFETRRIRPNINI